MSRIHAIDPSAASGRNAELVSATESQLGRLPNLYLAMATSPAALDGYLQFRGALSEGTLTPAMREGVALLTASANDCDYCVAAHCFRGAKMGLSDSELAAIQAFDLDDTKSGVGLRFAAALLERKGQIDDSDFQAVKDVGWTDEEIGEIVAHVALNVFSNYFNHVAQPVLDFPAV